MGQLGERGRVGDKSSGRYADLSRLHAIDHHGEHFKVAGPLNVERPPQGHPLLVQAGSSEDGKSFAARHAEAIFTAHQTYERARRLLRRHQGADEGGGS